MKAHTEVYLPVSSGPQNVMSDAVADHANIGAKENPIVTAAVSEESALTTLVKAWQRCGPTDRRLFLADICAGSPNIWRSVERDGGGRRR